MLTGYAVKGGGFNNALSALRTTAHLTGDNARLTITDAGFAALGDAYEPLPTGETLLKHWLGQLPKAERALLNALARAYPDPLNKTALAEQTGYQSTGGGFNNALSHLRTLELISGRNVLRASENLFA